VSRAMGSEGVFLRPSDFVATASSAIPVKSLHIGITAGDGGEGRVVSELMRSLPGAGVSFRGLVGAPGNAAQLTNGRMQSFGADGASLPQRLKGARKAIRRELVAQPPDVVASHFALYTLPALDLLRNSRNVSHFHGPWSAESVQEGKGQFAGRVKERLEGTVYRRADRVIVLSNAFAQLVVEDFGVDPERLRLVPGSVDVERFAIPASKADAKRELDLPTDRPILVSVRRLVRRMGLHHLLEALPSVVAACPDVLLCIGGRGPMLGELQAMAQGLGLEKNVRFLGFIPEEQLPLLYRAADFNVVPTEALEGFGLVAAEAIAAGTPSLVTPVGGLPEVVAPLSQSLVFESTSSADIAVGLKYAIQNHSSLPGEKACRDYARTHFTSELMAARTAAVYRELMK
jgi:glycosyltransferase involved in cell wall biosynthesis